MRAVDKWNLCYSKTLSIAKIVQSRWRNSVQYLWNDIDRAKLKYWEKRLWHCPFFPPKTPVWGKIDLHNLGRRLTAWAMANGIVTVAVRSSHMLKASRPTALSPKYYSIIWGFEITDETKTEKWNGYTTYLKRPVITEFRPMIDRDNFITSHFPKMRLIIVVTRNSPMFAFNSPVFAFYGVKQSEPGGLSACSEESSTKNLWWYRWTEPAHS
jgi:hypothetical protein